MDTPQLLVSLDGRFQDKEASFVAHHPALQLLESLPDDGTVTVISVAGLYRTGKSFIMNQLAGRNGGFDIGATVQPKTEGIWMWVMDPQTLRERGLPIPDSETREKMSVVLLDTEGLGSFTKNETHDVKIFSLAVLLCSYLIFNSLGTIDDTAVDNISLIVELTKAIKSSGAAAAADGDAPAEVDSYTLRTYFPKFMWLLRDFSLDLVQDGRPITADQYLENVLKPLPGEGPEIDSKNKVRECIRAFFENRTCKTLKRPVEDEELLQTLGQLTPDQFRPEYLQEAQTLVKYIYQHATPKTIFNAPINGKMFAQLVRSYVTSVNTGSVPVIETTWAHVIRQQTAEAVEDAIKQYQSRASAMSQTMQTYEQLHNSHSQAELDVLITLLGKLNRAALPATELTQLIARVFADIQANFRKLQADNVRRSTDANNAVAGRLFSDLAAGIAGGQIDSLEALSTAFAQVSTRYGHDALPPCDAVVWTQFAPKLLEFAQSLSLQSVDNARRAAEQEFDVERLKAKHEYRVLQELYQSVDTERRREEAQAQQLRAECADLRYDIIGQQKLVRTLESDLAELNSKCMVAEVSARECAARAGEMERDLARARDEVAAMAERQDRTETAQADAVRRAESVEVLLAEVKQAKEAEVLQVQQDAASRTQQQVATLQTQLEDHERQLARQTQELDARNGEVAARAGEVAAKQKEVDELKVQLEKAKKDYEAAAQGCHCIVM
ncbi:hypothetical protein RI367_002640 [Sorochytrium milnesiophthora]